MSLWKSLFGKADRPAPAPDAAVATANPADPPAPLAWIEADANPSGLRCLDCRAVAAQTIDRQAHPEQAARFATLRSDDGRALASLRPDAAVALPCALRMPVPSADTPAV